MSIVLVLLYIICNSFRFNQHSTILKVLKLKRKHCLEALHFFLNLGIPAGAFLIYFEVLQNSGICFYTIKHTPDCYGDGVEYWVFDSVLPLVLLDNIVIVLCVCVFIVWLCWLKSRHLLKARMKTVLREVGIWLGFFVLYFAGAILLEITHAYTLVVEGLLQSYLFGVFFVYICICLCSCCKQKTEVHHISKKLRSATSIQTDKFYETTPPSSRVSLPSDTAEHAPDFLSPSEEEPLEHSYLLL